METAFTITNEENPLSVVCVLHLDKIIQEIDLKMALDQLQSRHALLQAGILDYKNNLSFVSLEPIKNIPLKVMGQESGEVWENYVTEILNTKFDKLGPLMNSFLIQKASDETSKLILQFHHAIIDGISARLLLHELLSLLGGEKLGKSSYESVPKEFPVEYRGISLFKKVISFVWRQLKIELDYKRKGLSFKIPSSSENGIVSMNLSAQNSRKLSVYMGRRGISLNTILSAAIGQVVFKEKSFKGKNQLIRILSFANLRSTVIPVPKEDELGCYISMLQLNIPISRNSTLLEISTQIKKALFKSNRKGDIITMSILSKYLVKAMSKMQGMRLGVTALSYIGKLDLNKEYGPIGLEHVNAFITNNRLGTNLSAFGKILFGSIGLDFTYLKAEYSDKEAKEMVNLIQFALEDFILQLENEGNRI